MNILPKKKWHVRNQDNRDRVRKDEENARLEKLREEERIALTEQEVRMRLLRGASKESSGESSLQHINLFAQEEIEGGLSKRDNVEYLKEKKEEQEKYEKSIGFLTYVGQSSLELQKDQPWFDLVRTIPINQSPPRSTQNIDQLRNERLKREKIERERANQLLAGKLEKPNIETPQRFSSNESLQVLMQLASNGSELNDFFNKTNIESWGFPTNRLYFGNVAWLGAFDECQSINGSQYCVADMILFNNSIPLDGELGVCTPNECSTNDVFHLLSMTKSYLFSEFPSNGNALLCILALLNILGTLLDIIKDAFTPDYLLEVSFERNADSMSVNYNRFGEASVDMQRDLFSEFPSNGNVLLCILALLNILGTLLDIIKDAFTPDYLLEVSFERNADSMSVNYNRFGEASVDMQRGNRLIEIVMCFSVLKNIPRILSVTMPKNSVRSINGIRVISMSWVVLSHCYYFLHNVSTDNLHASLENFINTFSFQAISNAYVSADTFFLMSGFLVAYVSIKNMDKKGEINLLLFYLHRLLRVTPTYMLVIFIYSSLLPILINGPVTFKFKEKVAMCQKYWWTNLLYINNFYPKIQKMCLEWSWYLSNDMQFYFISPIFLYLMLRYKRIGALPGGFGILSCMIITLSLTAYYHIPQIPSLKDHVHKVNIFNDYIYLKPYTRFTPYLIGLLLGYVISRDIKIIKYNGIKLAFAWIVAFGIGLAVVYGPYIVVQNNNGKFGEVANIIYSALSKLLWAVAVSWVIYACHYNLGGLINRFLSWNVFLPISRLTFGVYLIHPLVLLYFYYSLDNPVHIESITMV
uniref:Leukocyte receptor cluster member 1 n=1 Tax=Hydra vulgaris TaxID=6087 RepID=T2M7V7_HYDVU